MKLKPNLLSAAILGSLAVAAAANAQDATKQSATDLDAVTVVGIRGSQQISLDTKRDAQSHVEVVSAEDIGKLPAKNIADTIAQLPGVNISDAAGAEGGFDEADRASLRGTAPSLTLTTVNGHSIASGDWFITGGGGSRSVSYALLPSEIVSQVVVHKSSEASLPEGGAAGTIDIITRKPLEFAKPFSAEASVGAVYSDLPESGKTKPQFNGLVNWKNSSSTFGVTAQAFYEKRSLQRDGQEMLGYSYIPTGSAAATQLGLGAATPGSASTGVFYPNLPGAALFTQTRERKGGSVDLEWKPLDNLTLNLDGFYSHMDATDYNRNYMLRLRDRLPSSTLSGATISDNIVTGATLGAQDGVSQGIYDMISRPGESESSQYITLGADWHVTDHLGFKFQGGTTTGKGNTPTQDVMELDTGYGQSASYASRGLGKPTSWSMGGINNANSSSVGFDWIFGDQDIHVVDKEHWFKADGEFDFDNSFVTSLQFGASTAHHTHNSPTAVAQGPWCSDGTGLNWGAPAEDYYCTPPATSAYNPAVYGTAGNGNYPGNFGSKLGASVPSNIWYLTPSQLAALNDAYANRSVTGDTSSRLYPNDMYGMSETNTAGYVQVNFAGDDWSGNFGLRYVHTDENIGYTSAGIQESDYSGPYLNSAFYPAGWYWNHYKDSYHKLLPSLNLKFNLNSDGSLLARFAASKTLTRQDYGQLAGFLSLSDPLTADAVGSGTGPNPYLKPLVSTNLDFSVEWYFSKRGLLSASLYDMNLHDYYDYGTVTRTYLNNYLTYGTSNTAHTPVYSNYLVSVPVNVNGDVKGAELNYIQPIGENFGTQLSWTYADGHTSGGSYLYNADGTFADNSDVSGHRPLFGTSKNTVNASVFFENATWNARVNYTWRSSFYDGMMPVTAGSLGNTMPLLPYYQAATGYLSFSAGYKLNDWVSFSFDAMNLNNPKLKYYVNGQQAGLGFGNAPEAFYVNGRQYYLTANFKF